MAHKLERINELVSQELGKIIFEEVEAEPGVLTTVMAADTSEDLRHTNVTVSVFPTKKGPQMLKILQARIFDLQQLLNKKLKIRPVPKIRFVLNADESGSQEIDTLLENLKNNHEN